jgi:hypothetical protein
MGPDGKVYPYKYPSLRQIKAAFRPFAHEIGYLAVVWNHLHDNLLSIFIEILKHDDFAAKAIWYSTDSDFQQRKMLRAVVELDMRTLFHHPEIPRKPRLEPFQTEAIFWLLNQIEQPLRHQRNNALHAPLMFHHGVVDGAVVHWIEATLNPQNPRAVPLQGKNLVDEFKSYAELTRVLSVYAARIANSLRTPGRFAWPEKPPLPRAHKTKKKIRQGKRQRPPRQRGASSA